MKSPHTLIKQRERLIRMLEMIDDAERRAASKKRDAIKYNGIGWTVNLHRDCAKMSDKYTAVAAYLRTRYSATLQKLQA